MKMRLKLFILAMFAILANISVFAADFTVGYLDYNVISFENMTCEVVNSSYTAPENVEIPSTVEYNGKTFTVVKIGENAFYYARHITVLIPNTVIIIGNYAFKDSNLRYITIPNSVTSIGGSAFKDCSSLTSVTLSNSLQSIGGSAFYGCSSLASITIPNSVTSIGYNAFSGCHPETIIIGRDYCEEISGERNHEIVLMEDYIGSAPNFSERSLNKVISLPIMPPALPQFSNSQIMDLEVLVPTSALSLYQQAEGWKDLWNLKGGAETVTGIENVVVSDKENKSCIYNINGMKVEHTVSGEIYIKDGKKFIAK